MSLLSRRDLLKRLALGSVVAQVVAACRTSPPTQLAIGPTATAGGAIAPDTAGNGQGAATSARALAPTPACDDGQATPEETEGPFFKPASPERRSLLEAGLAGTRLVVTGRILSTGCAPVAGALLDFWHADGAGQYDNVGFRLRGHQFTDAGGAFQLETIMPGLYPGRTRHIHVKAQAPGRPVLTTQLYFPDEPGNASDGLFMPELLMAVADEAGAKAARFDFVLETG